MNDRTEDFQRFMRSTILGSRRGPLRRYIPERERLNSINFNINDVTRNEDLKLSKIKIKNFKSIQNSEFDINQTVFLSGLNSSGKSSYTQAILLLLQWMTGSTTGKNGYLPLNGELISLGQAEDVYHRGSLTKNSPHFKEPITIQLDFADDTYTDDGIKYKILFELTPDFIDIDFDADIDAIIANDIEIEITKASSIITISKNDDVNLYNFFEKINSNREVYPYLRRLVLERDRKQNDEDLIIEQTYKKTESFYDNKKLTHKRWAGDLLMNRLQRDLFYIPEQTNIFVPEFTQKITYGEKYEIVDSRLFPSEIRIANEILPDGFIKDPNDILSIKTQSQRSSNNPDEMKIINDYRDSDLKTKPLKQVLSNNSIAIKGSDLARIRLLVQTINDIVISSSKLIHQEQRSINEFDINSSFDFYRNLNIKFDDQGFEYFRDAIKTLNKKELRKKGHQFVSSKPYIDQTLCLFLNIFDLKQKPEKTYGEARRRNEDNLFKDTHLNTFGFEIDEKLLINDSKVYLKNLSKNMKNLNYSYSSGAFVPTDGYEDLDIKDRRQVRSVLESFGDLFLRYVILQEAKSVSTFDFERYESRRGEQFPVFTNFLQTRAGKFFGNEQDKLADATLKIYIEFLKILDDLVNKTDTLSKDLWDEIRKTESVITGGIQEFDDEKMFTNKLDSYVNKVFLSLFPSFEKNNELKLEDIRKLLILVIGIRTFSDEQFKDIVYDQRFKDLSFKNIMNEEGVKPKIDETIKSFEINESNGITNFTFGSRMDQHDFVFVSIDEKLIDRKWFPNISEKFSFLSGSVNRNYQNQSGRSVLAPIGYHGEGIGAKFQLESNNSYELPTPNSLKILSDEKFRKQFTNDEDRISPYLLFSQNVKEPFIVTGTMSDHLGSWLNYIGLGESIDSQTSDFGFTSLNLKSDRGVDKLNNVGSGVSQALPVIFQILLSQDKILFLEEIEQNLHASAQARLADMVLLFSLDPRRNFIIETHSEHFVNRLRFWKMTFGKLFDRNSESPFNVFFAEIDDKKGTTLKRMDVDEDGYFTEDSFPKGFFDQTQLDLLEIMKLRNKEE